MTYQQALTYLYSFTDYEKLPAQAFAAANFDLRRVEQILHKLGDPHQGRLTIHIAGTKGKGSVAAMAAFVLQAAGFRTGLLTSPHLCDFRERIRVNGQAIAEADLVRNVEQIRPTVEDYHERPHYGRLTTFELVTIIGFLYFRQAGATAQVLEAGMGGRLDATNVMPKPDLCIITPISYDHTEILGSTLAAIAGEKSGIIKPGSPVIMAPQPEEARAVIARRCYEQKALLVDVERRLRWARISHDLSGQRFEVRGLRTGIELTTSLLGAFQMENAATVVAGIEVLRDQGVPVSREALKEGIANLRWPGRLQVLGQEPLLVLDGAHNGASAHRLREALESDFPHQRTFFVLGTSADKDVDAIAQALAPVADFVIATRSPHPRSAAPELICDAFQARSVPTSLTADLETALEAAAALAGPKDLICVTGSLFLVGEALKQRQPTEATLNLGVSGDEGATKATALLSSSGLHRGEQTGQRHGL